MGYKIEAAILLLLVAVLSVTRAQFQQGSRRCLTPDGRQGDCRNLKQCPELVSRLTASDRTNADIDYLRRSQCGFEGVIPYVCCASYNNGNSYVPTPRPTTQRQPTDGNNQQQKPANNELLPANCGRDESNRIIGGTVTDFWQYPWMALLEYDTPNGVRLGCGGALINNRYVLTAAHCLKGRNLRSTWRLNRVRLGEYNLDTEPDCIPDGDSDRICSNPSVTVAIEERIAHEDYDPQDRDQRYDIALLRLSRDVPFTDFIRPICLPRSSRVQPAFVVAGWGRTQSRKQSDVKLQVTVPFVDHRQCSEIYRGLGVRIGEGQMCAGGQQGRDSCTGDSGGPLMHQEKDDGGMVRWYAAGVVSFGPRICGTTGVPGVYTRLFDYIPWLTRKLRR